MGGGASTNWNAVGNTNWADTDGGANNATVPGLGDRVFLTALSGSGTSVLNNAFTIQCLDCTGYTGTLSHSAGANCTINTAAVNTLLFSAAMTYTTGSNTALFTFTHTSGTADITSNGKRLGGLTITGVGGTTRLLDAMRVDAFSASTLTLTNGTFNGNTFAVTATLVAFTNSNTRVLQLGDGTWTIGGNATSGATIWNATTTTGLTFTKGASNIVVPSNGLAGARTFVGGGLTYNNLTVAANSAHGAISMTGANTFAAFAVGEGNLVGLPAVTTTITAAPAWTGTAALPILVECVSLGSTATISIASGAMTLAFGGLRDVIGSGGATFVATNAYDFGNNTGWAITAPVPALSAADIRAAVGLASANLDTQLSTIDDLLDTEVAAIKAKTDSLTFTVAGQVDSNIQAVNDVTVTGAGTALSPWGP